MDMRLKKKVAVVVGSSRGLGLEIAKGFKEEGAIVIITYLKNKKLAKKQFLKQRFSDCLKLDIRSRLSLKNFYRLIKKYKKLIY